MSTLVLKVNNEVYQREERTEFGTVKQAIENFAKENKFAGAKMIPVNATNLGSAGKQMLLVIKEVDASKKPSELASSDTIHVGREISDMVRSGEIAFSALLDFPIILHENNTNGAEYPLVVKPTISAEVNEEAMSSFVLTSDTKVTRAYQREVTNIEDILKTMQV